MNASAIATVERRVLRGRGAAAWILVAVLALSAGTTMALVAGGRRAATSYDRLIAWSDMGDAELGGLGFECDENYPNECSRRADEYLAAAAALPQVESSSRSMGVGFGVVVPGGLRYVGTSFFSAAVGLKELNNDSGIEETVKIIDGRLFERSNADEAIIGFDVAERFDLKVGDTLGIIVDYEAMTTDEVTITGIIAYPGDFPSISGPVDPIVILTPAFVDAHPELVDWTNAGLSVTLRNGARDIDEYRQAVIDAGIPVDNVGSIHEQAVGPRQLVRVDAGVLWLLAVVVGVGSLVVVTQMLRRATTAATPDLTTLRALGMQRSDLVRAACRGGLRTGVAGACGATLIAIAGSPLFPVGISRTADPNPGFSVDFVVVGIGVAATVLVVTLLTCGATELATRRLTVSRDQRLVLASLANRLSPGPAAGVRLALKPASAGPGTTLRVGLLGLGSIIAILVAAMGITTSLDKATDDPALAGGTWDGVLVFEDPAARAATRRAIESDNRVDVAALGGWSSVLVNGREVFLQILDTSSGIEIATDRGRSPLGPTEIALGEAELDTLGVAVGDEVNVEAEGGTSQTATVVGRAVLASPRYRMLNQGEGAAVTPAFMARLGDEYSTVSYVVRLHDGLPLIFSIQELAIDLEANFSFTRPDRTGVQSLRDVRSAINIVLAVLGVLAVAALLHRLVVTSRSQRRQLAVLQAMGLTGGQVVTAGGTAGLTIVAVASIVAVPVGVIAGVIGWRAIADYLGVVPRPIVPWSALGVLVAALIAGGVVTGAITVGGARRQRPSDVLRTE